MDQYIKFINSVKSTSATDVKLEFYISGVYSFVSREIDNIKGKIRTADEMYDIHRHLCGVKADIAEDINNVLTLLGLKDTNLPPVNTQRYNELVSQLNIYVKGEEFAVSKPTQPTPPTPPSPKPPAAPVSSPEQISKSLASSTPSPIPPMVYSGLDSPTKVAPVLAKSTSPKVAPVLAKSTSPKVAPVLAKSTSPKVSPVPAKTTSPKTSPSKTSPSKPIQMKGGDLGDPYDEDNVNNSFKNLKSLIDITIIEVDILIGEYLAYTVERSVVSQPPNKEVADVYNILVASREKLDTVKDKLVTLCNVDTSGTLMAYVLPKHYVNNMVKGLDELKAFVGPAVNTITSATVSTLSPPKQSGGNIEYECDSIDDEFYHKYKKYKTKYNMIRKEIIAKQSGGSLAVKESDLKDVLKYKKGLLEIQLRVKEKYVNDILVYLTNNLKILTENAVKTNLLEGSGTDVRQSLTFISLCYDAVYNLVEELPKDISSSELCTKFKSIMDSTSIKDLTGIVSTLPHEDKHALRKRCDILFNKMVRIGNYVEREKPLYMKLPQISTFVQKKTIGNFLNCMNYLMKVQILANIVQPYNISSSIFAHCVEDVKEHMFTYMEIHQKKGRPIEYIRSAFTSSGLSEENMDELKRANKVINDKLISNTVPQMSHELLSILYDRIVRKFDPIQKCEGRLQIMTNLHSVMEDIEKFTKALNVIKQNQEKVKPKSKSWFSK